MSRSKILPRSQVEKLGAVHPSGGPGEGLPLPGPFHTNWRILNLIPQTRETRKGLSGKSHDQIFWKKQFSVSGEYG